jgi:biotin carboxylase
VVEGPSPDRRTRLLVLGAGPAQLGLLAAARKRGLYVIAVDRDADAPGFRYADRRAIVSAEDEHGIDRLAEAERVDGVIAPGIDWPVGIAARVAARRGLPHPLTPEAAVLTTSKARQRDRFAQAGVPQPEYKSCRSLDEARRAADELGYPCVVKAPDRQGQRGISVVSAREGLESAVAAALEAARSGGFLVEELVEGQEVTVNAFLLGGRFNALTITDRHLAQAPAFGVALAHSWPCAQPTAQIAKAIDAARRAAAALGITDGPTYTQVIVSEEGAVVGELAARLGGGHDAELCRAALRVDLNRVAISAALGEQVPRNRLAPQARVGGACISFLVAPPGELRVVHGLDEAFALDGVRGIRVYRRPGHVFGPLRSGSDRAGAILAVGDSAEDALARADEARRLIRFETETVGATASG